MIYFNEFEPFVAEWIGNLFPNQIIDDRSIKDVSSDDLNKFKRCHFFAGIGGWEYALQLAGWPTDRPVWTGSCPCQPLSSAGKQLGEKDERHLWPEFYRLISECRPPVIFGEQVANPLGREWLDGISLDLEELGYTVGAADLCAASIDAPHIRQRIFWVAYANINEQRRRGESGNERKTWAEGLQQSGGCCIDDGLANATSWKRNWSKSSSLPQRQGNTFEAASTSGRRLVDPKASGPQRHHGNEDQSEKSGRIGSQPWRPNHSTSLACRDGKARRIPLPKSGVQPLAYGLSRSMGRGRTKAERMVIRSARTNRVGRLKGYGNAIVPELAAIFIKCFMELYGETMMTTETETMDQSEEIENNEPAEDQLVDDNSGLVDESIDAGDNSEPAADEPESESLGTEDDEDLTEADQSWQSLAIETLWQADEIKGFGTAKRAAIIDEVTTLGEFQKLTQQVGKDCQHLKELLPQGCGEKLADELENRFLEFVANYANRDASSETESTDDPDFNLKEFIADLTSDENWMANLESDDNFEAGKADFLDGESLEDLQPSVLENHAIGSESLKQWCLGFAYAQREWEAEQDGPVDPDADQYEDVDDTDETVEPDLQSAVAGIDEL